MYDSRVDWCEMYRRVHRQSVATFRDTYVCSITVKLPKNNGYPQIIGDNYIWCVCWDDEHSLVTTGIVIYWLDVVSKELQYVGRLGSLLRVDRITRRDEHFIVHLDNKELVYDNNLVYVTEHEVDQAPDGTVNQDEIEIEDVNDEDAHYVILNTRYILVGEICGPNVSYLTVKTMEDSPFIISTATNYNCGYDLTDSMLLISYEDELIFYVPKLN